MDNAAAGCGLDQLQLGEYEQCDFMAIKLELNLKTGTTYALC